MYRLEQPVIAETQEQGIAQAPNGKRVGVYFFESII